MNDFGDLLGTPYAPVSKIAPVKLKLHNQPGTKIDSLVNPIDISHVFTIAKLETVKKCV